MSESASAVHLRVEGLRKSFSGVEVLHGVDFDAHGGRVVALLGENGAGKSTAIKILAGDYRRDAGRVYIDGEEVRIDSPADADAVGVKVIFQEFMDAPELTVAENIALGAMPQSFGVVRWRQVHRQAREILDELGVRIPVDAVVGELGVAQRQVLEIARSLVADARVLVLDEPTSALAGEEVASLFRFVRRLRARGTAIIYITHRLDEVAEIADDVLVFRDGDVVARGVAENFSAEDLVEAMVGQRFSQEYTQLEESTEISIADQQPVLQVREATIGGVVEDVSFEVRPGEVVCLFGRIGCGAVELAEAVFGVRPLDRGTITINGHSGQPTSPSAAISRGVGFVPIDRKTQGLLHGLSAAENISIAKWAQRFLLSPVLPATVAKAFHRWRDKLGITANQGAGQVIETLSGGNQQKVVLGRWLERESSLLVLAEPTRGVDVGARAEIYRVLHELTESGIGLLVVSSDMDEVMRISETVVVLSRGRVTRQLTRKELNRATLAHAAAMKEVSA